MRVFPGDTTEGLIGGLDPNLNYLFSISTSFNSSGIIYEGERTQLIPPDLGVTLTPTVVSSTSMVSNVMQTSVSSTSMALTVIQTSTVMVTSGTSPVTVTGSSTTLLTSSTVSLSSAHVCATVTTTVTVLENNGGNIAGWIVGVTVSVSLLAISIVVILILVMYIKRTNINQKRKSDNDIVMECSPAYATTKFKAKSTVEPVYDTTNDEYETPLPPPSTEYKIPTVTDL
uniref:Uncharacterized protein n=1 Tax=Amphimedon queenslandica TaxID=400682 RepID=A0A1X7SND4_AMPQE